MVIESEMQDIKYINTIVLSECVEEMTLRIYA